jgi:leucyl aminopeptidase
LKVEISADPKLKQIDNLFVLIAQSDEKRRLRFDRDLEKKVERVISDSGFVGRADEGISVLGESPRKITLIGLGKHRRLTHRIARAALHGVGKIARRNRDASIAVVFPYTLPGLDEVETTRSIADLLSHSDYRYDPYITVRESEPKLEVRCVYIPPSSIDSRRAAQSAREAEAIASAVRTVRDLGNGPGNVVTPEAIGKRAQEVAKEVGVKCTVYDKREIEKMGMGGLLAVNQGSAREPRLITLEYSPRRARKTVALVGKGITFDSGGISIKPAEKMEEMKFDMCGAAAVIGIIQAAAILELPCRLIGVIASTENLPSGSAYKPGDIVRTMSGKTIEVVNTDAEGRMILADALHYACTFKPDHVIDFATLTGACVVALGHEASGLFSTDDELAQKLIDSGEKVGERLWRLPVWDEYREYIRSEWADMKNSGGRWGGAITAALFLKEFVSCPSWAHLDIAGTSYTEAETARDPKGATGVGVRVTIAFLESLG